MNNTIFLPTLRLPKNIFYVFFIALFCGSMFLQSCGGAGMVPRDEYSLEQNDIIRADAINVIKRGASNYSDMSSQIEELKGKVNALTEYEREKGEKNMKTVKMWETMMDPNQALLGGFLNKWKTEGKLNNTFVREMLGVVDDNFKKIIKLEKKKKK